MNLLHAGVDITVIALWLGYESPTTTRIYPSCIGRGADYTIDKPVLNTAAT